MKFFHQALLFGIPPSTIIWVGMKSEIHTWWKNFPPGTIIWVGMIIKHFRVHTYLEQYCIYQGKISIDIRSLLGDL